MWLVRTLFYHAYPIDVLHSAYSPIYLRSKHYYCPVFSANGQPWKAAQYLLLHCIYWLHGPFVGYYASNVMCSVSTLMASRLSRSYRDNSRTRCGCKFIPSITVDKYMDMWSGNSKDTLCLQATSVPSCVVFFHCRLTGNYPLNAFVSANMKHILQISIQIVPTSLDTINLARWQSDLTHHLQRSWRQSIHRRTHSNSRLRQRHSLLRSLIRARP